ncbi:hypothetical protein ACFOGI_06125 [Virgibacillus xinjiangensis]|uniref:Uncharacterized protein n=1 Tax=Virgibacillus xinjiangensis TaxID=393090 RepID=A0ABV7CU87_9BACI
MISAAHAGNPPERDDIGSTRVKSAGARGYQQHAREIGRSARISAAPAGNPPELSFIGITRGKSAGARGPASIKIERMFTTFPLLPV